MHDYAVNKGRFGNSSIDSINIGSVIRLPLIGEPTELPELRVGMWWSLNKHTKMSAPRGTNRWPYRCVKTVILPKTSYAHVKKLQSHET